MFTVLFIVILALIMKTGEQTNSRLIVFCYFLAGLFFSYLGLALALLWLFLKDKLNTKYKLVYLTVGFGLSFVLSYYISYLSSLTTQQGEQLLFTQYPEMKVVRDEFSRDYPEAQIMPGVQYHLESDRAKNSSTFKLTIVSDKNYSLADVTAMGSKTCTILSQQNKSYTYIHITVRKTMKLLYVIPFNSYLSKTGKCSNWS